MSAGDPGASLSRFHGGLRLVGHKRTAMTHAIRPLPPAPRSYLWLGQCAGDPPKPCVQEGERVLRGQTIARADGPCSVDLHASTSGRILGTESRAVPLPEGGRGSVLVIEADGHDEPCTHLAPLADWRACPPDVLIERVQAAGIAGLGGAVFPTVAKLRRRRGLIRLILNGAECEPYISCDDALMRERAEEIIAGGQILMHILEAERAIIAVESDKAEALSALQAALADAAGEALRLQPIPPIYPAGGERQLIRMLTGQEVPSGGLPQDIGWLCVNVATAAAAYRAVCLGEPVISRIITITGSGISQPGNFEARIGTPVSLLLEAAGGLSGDVARLIMGGPMMGLALGSDEVPVVKAMNCLLAISPREIRDSGDALACIRCGDCAAVCPAVLLPQQLYWHLRAGQLEQAAARGLADCIECGCCDYVCPSHIPLTHHFRYGKGELERLARERAAATHARERYEAREARLASERRSRQEKLATKRAKLKEAQARQDRRAAVAEVLRHEGPRGDVSDDDDRSQT